ncbi:MAG TPA: glycoside hydrolase family 16 protein [Rhizobacter sp.]|nr:glycoside hydrolase family 16 protein [Rhizobacter sp.]
MKPFVTLLALLAAALLAGCAAPLPPAAPTFFDDFNQNSIAALAQDGWVVRTKAGHPGIAGAAWGDDGIALIDDPQQAGNHLLRLSARTDGTPAGTRHAQVCHARKYFEGTYAARVRFSNAPVQGPDGDVVVQTFYSVSPLRFDFDPQYSEIDWEYLPNGGWGDARTRLYGVTWQTVRIEPWSAHNQPHERLGELSGWHVLVIQVGGGRTRFYLDGEQLAEHGGRNYPAVPMSINFNLWFSPGGLLPAGAQRVYEQEVDWVYYVRDQLQRPAEVTDAVQAVRHSGATFTDSVPAANPPLASSCDF